MIRLYAIEQRGYINTDIYFDFFEESAIQRFAIVGNRDFSPITFDEYERAENNFDDFLYQMERLNEGGGRYNDAAELVNDIFYKESGEEYTQKEVENFDQLYKKIEKENNYNFLKYAAKILSIITGEEYEETTLRGYCQRDWAILIHPAKMDAQTVDYMEACFFGTGTEYKVIEADSENPLTVEEAEEAEEKGAFSFFDYTEKWSAGEYKKHLAQECGADVENIVIYSIESEKTITKYTYKES